MLTAEQVAAHFLQRSAQRGRSLTQMQLHKLCYFAQAYSLAGRGRRLFADEIRAYEHGPFLESLRPRFGVYGDRPIALPAEGRETCGSDSEQAILDWVFHDYGALTAGELRDLSHQDRPWRAACATGADRAVISEQSMAQFYRERLLLTPDHPPPLSEQEVRARLTEDDDLLAAVARGRADADAGRLTRWQ